MPRKLSRLCVVGGVGLSLACGGAAKINVMRRAAADYPAKEPSCSIQVFIDTKPEKEYVELGTINYHDERHRLSARQLKLEVVLPTIKRRACLLGADAIMDVHVTEEKRLEWAFIHVTATAIRFDPKR